MKHLNDNSEIHFILMAAVLIIFIGWLITVTVRHEKKLPIGVNVLSIDSVSPASK